MVWFTSWKWEKTRDNSRTLSIHSTGTAMGICLDTEQQRSGSRGQDSSEEEDDESSSAPSNASARRRQQHREDRVATHIKFESPSVPVIFVIGGPGSGKLTHCDNLVLERPGIVHINMADLLQQYAIGAEVKDFGDLSSETVTEVLMLEMKMATNALAYLVSGFPRNMRDVVEYSNKIHVMNGIILVSWRRKVLERQVAYGAKLGHVNLRVARMELRYFYRHTVSVAEYFDHQRMLLAVDGERDPGEVYIDFRSAVNRLLENDDNAMQTMERPSGVIEGLGSSVDANSTQPKTISVAVETHQLARTRYPPVIWVLGGPGSNKTSLCRRALRKAGTASSGWIQLSLGRTLRTMAAQVGSNNNLAEKRYSILRLSSRSPSPNSSVSRSNESNNKRLRQIISSGEMAQQEKVEALVESEMDKGAREGVKGILLDGFPRDLSQLSWFEEKFGQKPQLILLDCSKLQLGRGSLDDTVAAFRRRLQLFRELTLPMLRSLDQMNRLIIIDGDTDSPSVQEEFSDEVIRIIAHFNSRTQRPGEDQRQNRLANGIPHRPVPKLTPRASYQSVNPREQREVLDELEISLEEDREKRRENAVGNGVGLRGIVRAKEWNGRNRRTGETRVGNGITRNLQRPVPTTYQDNYPMQDSYI